MCRFVYYLLSIYSCIGNICIYIVLERDAIIREGELITRMNYRTQVIIPVLAV